ncbi:MAG: transcription antitermination factor NusB [Acidimicrobiia bacterium]
MISEAVELAKLYSTKDSGRYVNGLLSRVAAELRPGDPVELDGAARDVEAE